MVLVVSVIEKFHCTVTITIMLYLWNAGPHFKLCTFLCVLMTLTLALRQPGEVVIITSGSKRYCSTSGNAIFPAVKNKTKRNKTKQKKKKKKTKKKKKKHNSDKKLLLNLATLNSTINLHGHAFLKALVEIYYMTAITLYSYSHITEVECSVVCLVE